MANTKAIVDEMLKDSSNTSITEENKKQVNMESRHNNRFAQSELNRKNLVNQYREEHKVAISISPFYAPYLGKVVRQIVNGIVVDVPADGRTYMINETHASHLLTKIRRVDAMIARQEKAGDIKNNFEYSPGQLHL